MSDTNVQRRAAVRIVTSAKGGVGKSTVCANLGMALVMRGRRVLLIDCDMANRCLDLMLGMEDAVIYGIRDVIEERVSAQQAILSVPNTADKLRLLAGSNAADIPGVVAGSLAVLVSVLADGTIDRSYDDILIDLPGGIHEMLSAAAQCADEALIVSSAQATAIRSAETTAGFLSDAGVSKQRLIINEFHAGNRFFEKSSFGVGKRQQEAVSSLFSTVDAIAVTLLGVIPFDSVVWEAQNKGQLIDSPRLKNTPFAYAIHNIAARLNYHHVPLFTKPAGRTR